MTKPSSEIAANAAARAILSGPAMTEESIHQEIYKHVYNCLPPNVADFHGNALWRGTLKAAKAVCIIANQDRERS